MGERVILASEAVHKTGGVQVQQEYSRNTAGIQGILSKKNQKIKVEPLHIRDGTDSVTSCSTTPQSQSRSCVFLCTSPADFGFPKSSRTCVLLSVCFGVGWRGRYEAQDAIESKSAQLRHFFKRSIIFLRTLYSFVRLLPAYSVSGSLSG